MKHAYSFIDRQVMENKIWRKNSLFCRICWNS